MAVWVSRIRSSIVSVPAASSGISDENRLRIVIAPGLRSSLVQRSNGRLFGSSAVSMYYLLKRSRFF